MCPDQSSDKQEAKTPASLLVPFSKYATWNTHSSWMAFCLGCGVIDDDNDNGKDGGGCYFFVAHCLTPGFSLRSEPLRGSGGALFCSIQLPGRRCSVDMVCSSKRNRTQKCVTVFQLPDKLTDHSRKISFQMQNCCSVSLCRFLLM